MDELDLPKKHSEKQIIGALKLSESGFKTGGDTAAAGGDSIAVHCCESKVWGSRS